MDKKKYKRKKSLKKTYDALKKIKQTVPAIVFKAKNIVVTLRDKNQLKKWIELYPQGTFTINKQ